MTPELHSIVHVEMMHLGMAKSINDAAKMLCSVSGTAVVAFSTFP